MTGRARVITIGADDCEGALIIDAPIRGLMAVIVVAAAAFVSGFAVADSARSSRQPSAPETAPEFARLPPAHDIDPGTQQPGSRLASDVLLIRFKPGQVRLAASPEADIITTGNGAVAWNGEDRAYRIGPMAESKRTGQSLRRSCKRSGYCWPLKPFDRQHPVRGFFDDPRIGRKERLFHFGIDIAAPDGTPVYAVEAGRVFLDSPRAVAVVPVAGRRSLGYWHIVPVVWPHQFVGAHQLVGYVQQGWGHLHFAERMGRLYLNPLRRGALTPYVDRHPPTVAELWLQLAGRRSTTSVDLDVCAFDQPSPPLSGIWHDEPVTPALLRWRMVGKTAVGPWHTVVDFRWTMLAGSRFAAVYAAATRQNHPGEPGAYYFHLRARWNLGALRPGQHTLQVQAIDTRGNRALATLPIHVSELH